MIGHLYPFYTGCGTFANSKLMDALAGPPTPEMGWARVFGQRMLVPLDDYVGRAAYLAGDLDPKVSWAARRLIRPGDTIFDIGANYGLMSVLFASLVGPYGRVIGYEPNPQVFKVLKLTVQRNRFENVQLRTCALGEQPDTLRLNVPIGHAGRASLLDVGEHVEQVDVPVRRLDDEVAKLGIDRIDLLKIDVEGYELQVFRGGDDMLGRIRPSVILFESNERGMRQVDTPVSKLLKSYGYTLFGLPKKMVNMRACSMDEAGESPVGVHDLVAAEGEACEWVRRRLRIR